MRTKPKNPFPVELSRYIVDARSVTGSILPPDDAYDNPELHKARQLVIPVNVDAEFVDNVARTRPLDDLVIEGRTGVTVQVRGVNEPTGSIFARPEQADLAERTDRVLRHPVVESDCIIVDWLRSRGVDCDVSNDPDVYKRTRKSCRIQLYAHFALADVAFLAGTGEFEETIVDLYRRRALSMGRRLVARASGHRRAKTGQVGLSPWTLRIGEQTYRLTLEIVDTAGLHGVAGYGELAKNVGLTLDAKDTMSRKGPDADITRMDEIYFERPGEFDAYALGDLFVSDIIQANEALFSEIWTSLGIQHRYSPPKLTVGATVADLLKNRMAESIGATLDDDVDVFYSATTGNHNAGELAKFARSKNPLSLLAKVDGGRCRNAKPTTTRLSGALADIDIAGAYASAMTASPLVFGKVRQDGFGNARDIAANLEPCPTLAAWLKTHKRLVDRTWYARISTRESFTFENDLIPSWISYRVTTELSDSELSGLDVLTDPASGEMRYFGREIWSGTLTSDLLDVAKSTMSARQFAEFSDKVVVRSVVYVDERDYLEPHRYRYLFKRGELPEFAWTSLTLGELVSDVARANRKKVQRTLGKKTPLDILFKLVSNTTYGDSVSRHFATSSVISGSNVTGTVRAFMYLAEKGLNLVGSITDGQAFDLNRVLHSRRHIDRRRPGDSGQRRPSDVALGTRMYRLDARELDRQGTARLAPLAGNHIDLAWTGDAVELTVDHGDRREVVQGTNNVRTWIDDAAYDHLCRLWPNCKLLTDTFKVVDDLNDDGTVRYREQRGLFRFETKTPVSRAALHGSANYMHVPTDPTDKTNVRMRSFEANREHIAFTLDDAGELTYLDTYVAKNPAQTLLEAIDADPSTVPILPPFTKTRILKPGVYSPKPVDGRQVQSRYHAYGVVLMPGDSVYVIGRPRLFSLAQFTFQTRKQYDVWKRTTTRLINKYGLAFELWFTNPDGVTVDYQTMVDVVDRAIVDGVDNPVQYFNARYQRRIDPPIAAYHQAKTAMSTHLNGRLGADETGYVAYNPEYADAGFAGAEFA